MTGDSPIIQGQIEKMDKSPFSLYSFLPQICYFELTMFGPIRFLSAGESHGPQLTLIIEGFPAGVPLNRQQLAADLRRRQGGFGRSARMKNEADAAVFSAGIAAGYSTGAPIAVEIANADYQNWRDRDIEPMTKPRPGHADLTGALKYGHADLRLSLERASARESAMRVVIGALCKQLLANFDVYVGGYVVGIGPITHFPRLSTSTADYLTRFKHAQENEFCFIEGGMVEQIHQEIFDCMKNRDSLGGVIETVAVNVPVGLGSYAHFDRRLDAKLAAAILSVPAIKGMQFGDAFNDSALPGTKIHDEILLEESGELVRSSNQAAGVEGGISTGLPIVLRAAMKAISTTLHPRKTVDLVRGVGAETNYERSDFCAVPRALVVCEAMMAFVVANALLEKIGGDSLPEMLPRVKQLPRNNLQSLKLQGRPWRFNYDL